MAESAFVGIVAESNFFLTIGRKKIIQIIETTEKIVKESHTGALHKSAIKAASAPIANQKLVKSTVDTSTIMDITITHK